MKKITEFPKVTDSILFELACPGADGCFSQNPYKIDKITIYYVERDFLGVNFGEYTKTIINESLQKDLEEAEKNFCNNQTTENAYALYKIRKEAESSAQKQTFYYKNRITIEVLGSEFSPVWSGSNDKITLIEEDDEGNSQYGHFEFEWMPESSLREGDYFICWTWTPLPAGNKLSAHLPFYISSDPKTVITIPTHITDEEKYEVLLERYLPDMYKNTLTDGDITPQVLDKFNNAVAKAFKTVEDMAGQIIDLFDANALHESFLVYLSNLFNLKLKSGDPTLWRRQIKEAVPQFKQKGTLQGLKNAFAQSGMTLNRFIQYWQIISPYTWIESFKAERSFSFILEKNILPIDEDNFGIWLKRLGTTVYIEISQDYVEFSEAEDGSTVMTWIGDQLSSSNIKLNEGDYVKIMYQYTEIPGPTEQSLENYIRELPLADQREEEDQEYPLKNWNVRLIEEDDPLFNVLIPVRHPFHNPLIFGYIRTEFGYSENIYNREEYNASTRPSYDPCYIDKNFRDPCGACISSSYTVDINVESLSNDRMVEAQDILREYTPFHARLYSIGFTGEVNDFFQPPVETIETLVTFDFSQVVLCGQNNPFFHRVMEGGLSNWIITREDLTDDMTVLSGKLGTAYNEYVALITPDIILSDLGVIDGSHIIEILSPSPNAGEYQINSISGNMAKVVSSVIEPVDESAFTFNISNILYGNTVSSIIQDNYFSFSDNDVDFAELGVKTLWDIDNTPNYAGNSWKILFSYRIDPYLIRDVVNGKLILEGDSNLPAIETSDISYTIYNDLDEEMFVGTNGLLEIEKRGYVNLNDSALDPIDDYIKTGDYLYYNGEEYEIVSFDNLNFWIRNYNDGDATGIAIQTRRRLVFQGIGYFGYKGLRLITFADHESEFGMINGKNPPIADEQTDNSLFKENFMFKIENDFYKIVEIDEDRVILSGRNQNWQTLDAGGTLVAYSISHFPKKEINVQFTVFDFLDRNGKDPVIREIESAIDETTAIAALSSSGGMQDNASQEEGISFTIETRTGDVYEGDI